MDLRVLIVCVLVAAGGCEKRSALYCDKNPQDLANCEQQDAAIDAPLACIDHSDCSPPFCEPQLHVCVECLDDLHCGTDEKCDPETFRCRGCVGHTDCTSNACLPDGSCGTASTVLYVEPSGDDANTCTIDLPCATLDRAVELSDETRRIIKISGSWTESVIINGKDVVLVAEPGSTITGTTDDWVIKIQSSVVKIYGLALRCVGDQTGIKTESASTTTLSGVTISNCARMGAVEMKGGFTVVTRSTLSHNPGGAIVADAAADWSITNNFIYRNGSSRGAVVLESDIRPDQRFEFNTIADNTSPAATTAGIACTRALVVPNNLIARNSTLAVVSANTSGCDVAGSLVTDNIAPLAFTRPDAEPYDYHIGADSTAKDNADPASIVGDDFDGELRPQGDGKDFGADEYRAP